MFLLLRYSCLQPEGLLLLFLSSNVTDPSLKYNRQGLVQDFGKGVQPCRGLKITLKKVICRRKGNPGLKITLKFPKNVIFWQKMGVNPIKSHY